MTEYILSFIPIATVVVSVRVGIGVVEGLKDGVILEINRRDVVLIVKLVLELGVCMMIGWQMIRAWLVAASVSVVWSGASIPILRLISHIMMRHHTEHVVVILHWGNVVVAISGWVSTFTFIVVIIDNILSCLD